VERYIRAALLAGGLLLLLLTAGFYFRWPLATGAWPWPDSRLSYIFLASIFAAIAAPVLWLSLTGEFAAAAPGALDLTVTYAGATAYLAWLYRSQGERHLLVAALTTAVGLLLFGLIYWWSRRIPLRDPRSMPPRCACRSRSSPPCSSRPAPPCPPGGRTSSRGRSARSRRCCSGGSS